jgi:hypothetical protein
MVSPQAAQHFASRLRKKEVIGVIDKTPCCVVICIVLQQILFYKSLL